MDLGLAGKRCLVSGASRGIGRAIAHALAAEGARIAAVARGEADLDALLGELAAGHAKIVATTGDAVAGTLAALARTDLDTLLGGLHAKIVADVATPAGADAAIAGTLAAFGGIDIVIANVGKSFARTADQLDDDDLAKSLEANLWTTARVAQRAVPHMTAGGSITMISSLFGREAGGAPGYNVAKAAVIALAKALSRDYGARGIRVNSIAPGSILFPGGGWDRRQQADPAGIADFVKRELPHGRFGTPEEIAAVVAFVASPRASLVNGACIAVDGSQSRAF